MRERITRSHVARAPRPRKSVSSLRSTSSMHTQSSSIRALFLSGPTGRLEALLNAGSENATHAALVCHPHPLYGGTLHNKVVFHAMKALNSFGFPVLRFNFRGAGLSQGEHDHGLGEVDDVHAALDWLDREFDLPIIFAGFSFGAAAGLRASGAGAPPQNAISPSLPPAPPAHRSNPLRFLPTWTHAKPVIKGGNGPIAPAAELEKLVVTLSEPKKLIIVEGADHFFEGRMRELRETIEAWLRECLST